MCNIKYTTLNRILIIWFTCITGLIVKLKNEFCSSSKVMRAAAWVGMWWFHLPVSWYEIASVCIVALVSVLESSHSCYNVSFCLSHLLFYFYTVHFFFSSECCPPLLLRVKTRAETSTNNLMVVCDWERAGCVINAIKSHFNFRRKDHTSL